MIPPMKKKKKSSLANGRIVKNYQKGICMKFCAAKVYKNILTFYLRTTFIDLSLM